MAAKKTTETVQEENPSHGGSFTRNTDGTLTQTEGSQPQPQPGAAPASAPAPTANIIPITQEQ